MARTKQVARVVPKPNRVNKRPPCRMSSTLPPPPKPPKEGDWIPNTHLGFIHHRLGMCGPCREFLLHFCSSTGSDKSLKAACDERDAKVCEDVQSYLDEIVEKELEEQKRITKLREQLAEERTKLNAARQRLTDAQALHTSLCRGLESAPRSPSPVRKRPRHTPAPPPRVNASSSTSVAAAPGPPVPDNGDNDDVGVWIIDPPR
jgi:hypothetical protein